MADKQKKSQPRLTRKRLVGLQRERAMNRVIFIVTAVIVLVVIGLVLYGSYKENVVDPNVIVAEVEGVEITGREFQARVRVNRQTLVNNYILAYQNYLQFEGVPELQQQSLAQMQQFQFQLLPATVGAATVNQLVDDRLLILEGQKLGFSFTEEDVDEALQEQLGYYPNGLPSPTPSLEPLSTSTLSAAQLAIVSPTPTLTAIPTASLSAEDEQATLTAEAEPTATEAPTPTLRSLDGYEQDLQDYLDFTERDLGFTEEDLRFTVLANLYRDALYEMQTADTPRTMEQVWARHILVTSEEEAQSLLDELDGGADWAELAAENSLDTNNAQNGGDLGWFSFETMVEPFAEAAFDLDIGEISEPVQSTFGWHIIQVLGHEDRPLSDLAYRNARNDAFDAYVLELRGQYDYQIFNTWFDITPTDPEIPAQAQLPQ